MSVENRKKNFLNTFKTLFNSTMPFLSHQESFLKNLNSFFVSIFISKTYPLMITIRVDFKMGFFGIGLFYFELDQKIPKIPKSLESGSRFENSEKIPSEKSR